MVRSLPTALPLAVALALACAGCGYRPLLTSGGDAGPVMVPMARNETAHADLAAPLTQALRTRLEALGVEVVGRPGGASVLAIVIRAADGEPGMVGAVGGRLAPRDAIWRVELEVSLTDPGGGGVIPPTIMEGTGRAVATGGALGEELSGGRTRAVIIEGLVERIALMVVEAGRIGA